MYLLDTNILSELIKKRPHPGLLERLSDLSREDLYTSAVCAMELRMGAALRDDFKPFWEKIHDEILSRVNTLPIGIKEAKTAGDILAQLRTTGQWIGIEDVLIAATAIPRRLVVVTANTAHFSRIPGLKIENWLQAP